jgi:pimeloyl-ACP methyl ester carboxylesterase
MGDLPVVLVHGWGGSFASTWQGPGWEALLEDAGRTVIGVDLLGHGTAPKPHDPAAYADLTQRISAALPSDGSPVDAIGFSLGAITLLTLASREPGRFGRIVVGGVGQNVVRRDDSGTKAILAALRGTGDPADIGSQVFAHYASQRGNDAEALAAVLERERPPLDADALGRIACPVLVCLGTKDFAGPAEPLLALLPNARYVPLQGVDHFATPESFAFIDAALEFLDALPA